MGSYLLSKSLSYSKGNLYIDTRSKWVIYIFCVDGLFSKVIIFAGVGVLNFAFGLDFLPFFCSTRTRIRIHARTRLHVRPHDAHTHTHTHTHAHTHTQIPLHKKLFICLRLANSHSPKPRAVKPFQQIRAFCKLLIYSSLRFT